jgi:GT2 family glycosyltransferase
MDISIIIVNYHSESCLPKCIKSIQEHAQGFSYEIIIVNNDPDEITTVPISNNISIINQKINTGFASACNLASLSAKGDILFFLNPDTEITMGNILEVITGLKKEAVGIVAPKIIDSTGKIQPWSAGYEVTLFDTLCNNIGFVRSAVFWDNTFNLTPEWVSGAALAIRKNTFHEVGGFDKNFFMYFEDVDLSKKIRKKSLSIQILPNLHVLHLGGQSFSQINKQKKLYYISQDYYFKKHLGNLSCIALKFLRKLFLPLK